MIGYSLFAAFLVIGLLFASNYIFFRHSLQLAREIGIAENDLYFQLFEQQRSTMTWLFLGTATTIYGILFVGGVLLSHRIAGPIFRMCKEFESVSNGEPLKEVKFRPRDYFPELARTYNGAVQRIVASKKP